MNVMIMLFPSRRQLLALITAALLSGMLFARLLGDAANVAGTGNLSSASWADTYRNPESQARGVDGVYLAEFAGAAPGRIANGGELGDTVSFENATFRIAETFKGTAQPNEDLVVEGVADFSFDADGGAYDVGKTYVLFVNEQTGTGLYYLVNDEGRYQVIDNRLEAAGRAHDRGPVARALSGRTLPEFRGLMSDSIGRN